MSSDPAVNAAQRAIDAADRSDTIPGDLPLAAAREALAPLRRLHYPISRFIAGKHIDVCRHCWNPSAPYIPGIWPCEDAKHLYSAEELR